MFSTTTSGLTYDIRLSFRSPPTRPPLTLRLDREAVAARDQAEGLRFQRCVGRAGASSEIEPIRVERADDLISLDTTLAQSRALVGASVLERVNLILTSEDGHFDAVHRDGLANAFREVRGSDDRSHRRFRPGGRRAPGSERRRPRGRRLKRAELLPHLLKLSVPDEPFEEVGKIVAGNVLHDLDARRCAGARRSPDEHVDGVHTLAFDLCLCPQQPDVRYGVVAAARRTPRPVDRDGLSFRKPRFQRFRYLKTPPLCFYDGQITELNSRAAHEAPQNLRRVVAKDLQKRLGKESPEHRIRYMRNNQILVRRQPNVAGPVSVGQPGNLLELIACHPPHRDEEPDVVQSRLPLAEDADMIRGFGEARVGAGRLEPSA